MARVSSRSASSRKTAAASSKSKRTAPKPHARRAKIPKSEVKIGGRLKHARLVQKLRLRELAANKVVPLPRGQLPVHVSGTAKPRHRIAFTFAGQGGLSLPTPDYYTDAKYADKVDQGQSFIQDKTGNL